MRLEEEEIAGNPGTTLVSFIWPAQTRVTEKLAEWRYGDGDADSNPYLRAQSLDALSSMANIAGYRAVEAAHEYPGALPAKSLPPEKPPAKVMVIGAGVAGLVDIGAANSPGRLSARLTLVLKSKTGPEYGAEFRTDFKEEMVAAMVTPK